MLNTNSTRIRLFLLIGICMSWMVLYAESLNSLISKWNNEDYSYCYLVPFLAVYFAYRDRTGTPKDGSEPHDAYLVSAYVGLALSIALFFAGRLGSVSIIVYFSMWLSIGSVVVLLTGNPFRRGTIFPLVVLLFAIPIHSYLGHMLTFRLQLISTAITVKMLNLLGILASSEGNIIDMGNARVQVVEACSGLHYVLSTLFLALLTGYFFNKRLRERVVLLMLSLPLAIFMNSVRVSVMAVCVKFISPDSIEGSSHVLLGLLVFVLSLSCLILMSYLLSLMDSRNDHEPESVPEESKPTDTKIPAVPLDTGFSITHGFVIVSIFIALCFLKAHAAPEQTKQLGKHFSEFPTQIGKWSGKKIDPDPGLLSELAADDFLFEEFTNSLTGNVLYLMVPYYGYQIMDRVVHNPYVCLVGGGWNPRQQKVLEPARQTGPSFAVQQVLSAKEDRLVLTVFWFQQGSRKIVTEYEYKMYLFWSSLMQRRSDGGVVRMDMELNPGQRPEDAQALLDDFILDLDKALKWYFCN